MEHKTITVKEVHPPREFQGRNGLVKSYSITGEDNLKYESMSNTIAGYFVVGKVIEADVEDKPWQTENASGTNHYIRQVYDKGQPVSGQKGGGRSYSSGSTPEDRASIESQCAAKVVAELWIAGRLEDDSLEVGYLRTWSREHLRPLSGEALKEAVRSAVVGKDEPIVSKATDMSAPAHKATPAELNKLAEVQKKAGKTNVQLQAMIPREWNIKARTDLTQYQCQTLIDKLTPKPEQEDLPF